MTNLDNVLESRDVTLPTKIHLVKAMIFPVVDGCELDHREGCVCMLVAQSRPILCDPMDCNLPDSSVHGILQARILEYVAMPFSRGSS